MDGTSCNSLAQGALQKLALLLSRGKLSVLDGGTTWGSCALHKLAFLTCSRECIWKPRPAREGCASDARRGDGHPGAAHADLPGVRQGCRRAAACQHSAASAAVRRQEGYDPQGWLLTAPSASVKCMLELWESCKCQAGCSRRH